MDRERTGRPRLLSCSISGGNAEDVLYTASTASDIECERGGGRQLSLDTAAARASRASRPLYDDGLAIYDYAIKSGVSPEHIVVVAGRSLGSGVASMLAGARPVHAAVLITPSR